MIAHSNSVACEIHLVNNGTAQMKTEVQQEPSEAAADEDSGSCSGTGRISGLRIVRGNARQKSSEFVGQQSSG